MSEAIAGLEPKLVWEIFAGIAAVPRPSKHEEKIIAHLDTLAKNRGFVVDQDLTGNLVIRVPATPGYESAPVVVMQGHVDMVCEKNSDVEFDFLNDGIKLRRDGDWLRGTGTTLGADNGLGVAMALAAAMDPSVVHGPLEILLTVDEETGLTGAMYLANDLITGRILLNLDSEETGIVYMGCAGGAGVSAHLPLRWTDAKDTHVGARLVVRGLRGGHSGGNIHENRANAVKILARTLKALSPHHIHIADMQGGDKHNAIPREAFAVMSLPQKAFEKAAATVAECHAAMAREFPRDPDFVLELVAADKPARVLDADTQTAALAMLLGFPNGVLAMSQDLPNLVETSTNLASIRIEGDALAAHNSPRSSNATAIRGVIEQIDAVARLAGAVTEVRDPYPGWQPNPDSRILRLVETVHEEVFGTKPERKAIHAGLECGIIGEKFPGMDMVSFGPDIQGAHSPDERAYIPAVAVSWKLLAAVLEAIARGRY